MQAKQQERPRLNRTGVIGLIVGIALLVWARELLWLAVQQLLIAAFLSLMTLPVMKLLEKKLKRGLAASLAMLSLSVSLIVLLLVLVPPIIAQGRELASRVPQLYAWGSEWLSRGQNWLSQNGIDFGGDARSELLSRGQELLSGAAPAVVVWVSGVADSLGKWLFAPVFSYYFLRDRRRIAEWMLSLLPAEQRGLTVRLFREMRRETAGYLRGQLMISAVVGGLTAAGLLFCGVPAWLLLGLAMGLLEFIPYVGPFLGGVLVLFFSLPSGLSRTLWAMGVVVVVQQLEGGMLSPQLMSDATKLHPVAVLLCVMLGGAAAGVVGILLSVPILLCVRAALRVFSLRNAERMEKAVSTQSGRDGL